MTMAQCVELARNWSDDPWIVWLVALELFYEDRE